MGTYGAPSTPGCGLPSPQSSPSEATITITAVDDDKRTLHRRDFSAQVSERSGLKFEIVDNVLVEFFDAVGRAFAARRRVSIRGFGVFEPRERAATMKRKPDTQELIPVPAGVSIGFRPSPALKARMKGESYDETPD